MRMTNTGVQRMQLNVADVTAVLQNKLRHHGRKRHKPGKNAKNSMQFRIYGLRHHACNSEEAIQKPQFYHSRQLCSAHLRMRQPRRIGKVSMVQAAFGLEFSARRRLPAICPSIRLRRSSARQRQVGHAPVIDSCSELIDDAFDVLVQHGAEHRIGVGMKTHVVEILRQRGGGVRVVRDVRGSPPARPGKTWKRPGNSTVARPVRTSCAPIGNTSRKASSAASAAEALSNWLAPRRLG